MRKTRHTLQQNLSRGLLGVGTLLISACPYLGNWEPEAPAAPSVIRGNRQLMVSWTAGGADSYEVWYGETSDSAEAQPAALSGRTALITDLENHRIYYVWVKANYAEQEILSPPTRETPEAPPLEIPEGFVYLPGGTISGSASFATGPMTKGMEDQRGVFIADRMVPIASFLMDQYETTGEVWSEVRTWAEWHGYTFSGAEMPPVEAGYPVTGVSWWDAVLWCNAYSEKQGLEPVYRNQVDMVLRSSVEDGMVRMDKTRDGFRLPTAAEGEFAARGGNPGDSSWYYPYAGSWNIDQVAWYAVNAQGHTHQVGTKQANTLDLYDLTGNVSEWCWDWDGDLHEDTGPDGPAFPGFNPRRIYHNSSYDASELFAHITCRVPAAPTQGDAVNGFRLVRKKPD